MTIPLWEAPPMTSHFSSLFFKHSQMNVEKQFWITPSNWLSLNESNPTTLALVVKERRVIFKSCGFHKTRKINALLNSGADCICNSFVSAWYILYHFGSIYGHICQWYVCIYPLLNALDCVLTIHKCVLAVVRINMCTDLGKHNNIWKKRRQWKGYSLFN